MSARIVSIRLWGGLCNRLFQIACCYSYAEKYKLSPVFYTCFFNNNEHTPAKETINIINELIPGIDIRTYFVSENDFYIIEVSGDLACKYVELALPPTEHTCKNILLKGYFQSEKYFPILEDNKFLLSYAKKIVQFKYNEPILTTATKKYFIHIRLGDYEGHYLHYLGYRNYLQTALKYILEREPNARFVICSNEKDKKKILEEITLDIAKDNILSRINYEFEIDMNPELNPLQTLRNMALCNGGGICLNSSFSWFGAYLSRLVNKVSGNVNMGEQIFVMPDKWFNERYILKDNYCDIYPEWSELTTCNI